MGYVKKMASQPIVSIFLEDLFLPYVQLQWGLKNLRPLCPHYNHIHHAEMNWENSVNLNTLPS